MLAAALSGPRSQRLTRSRLVWAVLWALGSAFMVVQVGFWNDVSGVELQDVNSYEGWADFIVREGALPLEETWQYPPGAGYLLLIPRLGGDYGKSFVALMVLFYLAGTVIMAALAERERRQTGIWVWLLAMPLLAAMPVLRFDLVPTVLAMAALLFIHRRPAVFGALAGIGAMVKMWPALVLFGEWNRRRLLVSVGAAVAVAVLMFGAAAVFLDHPTGFLSEQEERGLQIESVGATPWHLREMVTGEQLDVVPGFGTNELRSTSAETVSTMLTVLSFLVLIGAAVWWLARTRAIRGGRTDLATSAVSIDFVFAIVLLQLVTSRVLSPQFMIWMVGMSAVTLTAGSPRSARPAWIVIGAVLLTAGLYQSPANFVIRNLALLVAATDMSIGLVGMLRGPRPTERRKLEPELAAAGPG